MNYASIAQYKRYLLNFNRSSIIRTGYMYAFLYEFNTDYKFDIVKYFDHLPLTFVLDVNLTKKLFGGINIHHMSVEARILWYKRIKAITKIIKWINIGRKVTRLQILNYRKMLNVFRGARRIYRQYRFDRVQWLRQVPLDEYDNIIRFYGNTYYGTTYGQVSRKYHSIR